MWSKPFKGIDATLRPDSSAYGGHNFVLNAVYRVVSPDEARFAVFLPQGNKLGQCVRKGRDVSCSGLSFPGAGSLIRSSFAALDEMVLSAPGEDDSYELSYGDRNTDICGERLVLRRKRSAQAGASYVITEPDGVPVSAYRRGKSSSSSLGEDASSRIDAWRIMFSGKPGNYRFMPQGNNWMIDVSIVRFVE
ncbi:hypothetical protein LJC48_02250 [Desulfovibrio sp. OttesenSCG-928-C06]|nr:hypothetical protein [Desulfovibrio sp. OttesenSCG-928-C06]